jgi:hypothetical protein
MITGGIGQEYTAMSLWRLAGTDSRAENGGWVGRLEIAVCRGDTVDLSVVTDTKKSTGFPQNEAP